MAFPKKFLNEGEDVLMELHPHLWTLIVPGAAVVATLVGAAFANSSGLSPAALGLLALGAMSVLWLLGRWTRWVTTTFVLTTDRIIYRRGIFSRSSREIPLERVNDLSCTQSLFERLIGAGDLLIESGGERGQQVITDVPRPFGVQNEVYKAIEESADRDAARVAGRRELSVPEQIEKLDELRKRGVLSDDEFEAKKAQLLDRI